VILPLFSMPSRRSWGIGEIADLPRLARWLQCAGLDFVQLLPVNEMQEGQSSPYAALSAMALDPIFVTLDDVPEFAAAGGMSGLSREDCERVEEARRSPRVDYASIRLAKRHALAAAFDVFDARTSGEGDPRQEAFERYVERERWWLEDYALFRALHDEHRGRYWREWEPPLQRPTPRKACRHAVFPQLSFPVGAS
jgi:4-alpha-glucanotransferase